MKFINFLVFTTFLSIQCNGGKTNWNAVTVSIFNKIDFVTRYQNVRFSSQNHHFVINYWSILIGPYNLLVKSWYINCIRYIKYWLIVNYSQYSQRFIVYTIGIIGFRTEKDLQSIEFSSSLEIVADIDAC